MQQSSFDFGFVESRGTHDFVVSESNRYGFDYLTSWPKWESPIVFLYGPHASGKSHLAQIWQGQTGARLLKRHHIYSHEPADMLVKGGCYIFEDIEQIHDEVTLLHWYNSVIEIGAYALFTAEKHPANLNIRLADLRSRLMATYSIGIGLPDDHLLKTLFAKLFADRQLRVNGVVVDFLIARMERSFLMVQKLVDLLDKKALVDQKPITVHMAKKILHRLQEEAVNAPQDA